MKELIAKSQEIKAMAFEAIKLAKRDSIVEAKSILKKSKDMALLAFERQSEIISNELDKKEVENGMLLLYAQSSLGNALLARDIAEELVELYEKNYTWRNQYE